MLLFTLFFRCVHHCNGNLFLFLYSAGVRVPPHKRRDYSPLHWSQFYDEKKVVDTCRGKFCTYKKGSLGKEGSENSWP